ncbi:MAG: hypothetical protein ACR2NX_14395 [Chthoniobacterales bacterium]
MIVRFVRQSILALALIVSAALARSASPASAAPTAPFRAVPDFFQLPAGANFGEVLGVAGRLRSHR